MDSILFIVLFLFCGILFYYYYYRLNVQGAAKSVLNPPQDVYCPIHPSV